MDAPGEANCVLECVGERVETFTGWRPGLDQQEFNLCQGDEPALDLMMRGGGVSNIGFTERAAGCWSVEEMCWVAFVCCHTG